MLTYEQTKFTQHNDEPSVSFSNCFSALDFFFRAVSTKNRYNQNSFVYVKSFCMSTWAMILNSFVLPGFLNSQSSRW